jgi:PASTA domain
VSGATVHLTGAGACTVTASQSGNANYKPAANVSRTFAIAKLGQTIAFGPLPNKTYGAPDFTVSATVSSGLPVSFTASGRCTLGDATVHLTGAGSCTVTASQPGNANYNPAAPVSRSFSIKRPPCRVPKVVGKRLGAAKKLIAKKHCRTGRVGHAYSRKRKKGIVISQSRRPGRVLPANTKINLVVSRGRKH